jgi:DNA repair photolyase
MTIEVKWRKDQFIVDPDVRYIAEVNNNGPTDIRITVRPNGKPMREVFATRAPTVEEAKSVAREIEEVIEIAQLADA